jgi:Protein of unknown function (DUF2996)
MADETNPTPEALPTADAAAPEAAPKAATESAPKAAKKEKPPALEDKPLPEFMAQDCLPVLQSKLADQGLAGLELTFSQQNIAVKGYETLPNCWQIVGKWQAGQADQFQAHQFNVYFFDADLQGQRGFSASIGGSLPSTMESFRIDERKMSLELLVSGVVQRLNSQKWLTRN